MIDLELLPEAKELYDSDEPFEVGLFDSGRELIWVDGYERKVFSAEMQWDFTEREPPQKFQVDAVRCFTIGGRDLGAWDFSPIYMVSGDSFTVYWKP